MRLILSICDVNKDVQIDYVLLSTHRFQPTLSRYYNLNQQQTMLVGHVLSYISKKYHYCSRFRGIKWTLLGQSEVSVQYRVSSLNRF